MASNELTGASPRELEEMKEEHKDSPLYQNHDIPFEVAYCLNTIARQPDEYDGPDRYCRRRATKRDESDYDGHKFSVDAYKGRCKPHGGEQASDAGNENLENPLTAAITHGAHSDDEHLIMDFNEHEQDLYDEIMEEWPEIYDWPERSEDPARYRILRRVAVNEVRALREEDYLDDAEVVEVSEYDDQGVEIGSHDEENPLAREYRLLMSEVTNQMRELGLTPKERQKMDTLSSEENKNDVVTEIASDALDDDEQGFDPDRDYEE